MIMSNRKYTEPSIVLRALVDDFGQPILFGDQKDIGEFNLNFLERIEEGLGERKMAKLEIEDLKAQDEKLFANGGLTKGMEVRKSSIIDDGMDTPQPESSLGDDAINTIQKLFFGRIVNILKVDNAKRTKIFSKKIEKMGPIMLDVNNYGSLYDAWNSQGLEDIEDFNCKEVA